MKILRKELELALWNWNEPGFFFHFSISNKNIKFIASSWRKSQSIARTQHVLAFLQWKKRKYVLVFFVLHKKKRKRRRVVYILNFLLFCSHLTYLFTLYDFYKERKIYERNTTFFAFFLWEKHEYRLHCAIFEIFQLFVMDIILFLEMLKTLKKEIKFSNLIISALSESRLKWTLGPAQ